MKRVFSGIQPTGSIHVGNYLGITKNWLGYQEEHESIFCIVDLHALTVQQEAEELRKKILTTAKLLLASGIDPVKHKLFVQSHVSAHSELAWILNCFTPMGWMERMTQFKEKTNKNKERANLGLFSYPALMAADILLYDTNEVPVGEDQRQHVELARDIAKKINSHYGQDVFVIPKARISGKGSRIKDLQSPEGKMSKTDGGEKGVIFLRDDSDSIERKIMNATTDSENKVVFDENRPGIYNLLTIYEAFSGENRKDIEKKFEGKGYAEFKKDLVRIIIEPLKLTQKKFNEISDGEVEEVLKKGADKVRPIAEKKIKEVKDIIGLG